MLAFLPVVWRLSGNRDIMHVAFSQPGAGDPAEAGIALQLLDIRAASIPHTSPQTADQLVNHPAHRTLVAHPSLDPLRDQLEGVLDLLLEVPVGRTPRHGPDAAHPAITL